jgi:hypothetical protein
VPSQSTVGREADRKRVGKRFWSSAWTFSDLAQDLVAVLALWRNLFEHQRRIVEHSQLEIATRSKNVLFPIGIKGIGHY